MTRSGNVGPGYSSKHHNYCKIAITLMSPQLVYTPVYQQLTSESPVIYQTQEFVPNSSRLCAKAGARLSRVPSDGAGVVLQRHGTIVIMEACKLFSRRRVATTACAVLPTPGIVG
jgi:hypothetical protein